MASLWHWLVFLLVLLGSALILVGFIRVSHANGGRAKVAADWLKSTWSKLTHTTARGEASGTLHIKIEATASASVLSGPLDPTLTDTRRSLCCGRCSMITN